jgi:hypothetical protein
MTFGKSAKIDDQASIVDYLYHWPVKMNALKTHREKAFAFLSQEKINV